MTSVRKQIAELDLQGVVDLPGFLPAAELLSIADIFCHTYLGEEGLGLTILEAMSVGKATIATEQGGPREIIQNDQNGLLVPGGDADALAKAIRKLTDAEERERIGKEAKKRIHACFNIEEWGRRWVSALDMARTPERAYTEC
jgi:glycosyltransferase involved in cell wall biosynthesis